MAKDATQKFNVYEYVTEQILTHLKAGTVPWRKPWSGSSQGFQMPVRVTGEPYSGINVLLLWIAVQEKGYVSHRWMTYKQAQDLGGQVRKGEKSTTIIKYGTYEAKDTGAQSSIVPVARTTGSETRAYVRAYRVFNADQIDGLPEEFYGQPADVIDYGTEVPGSMLTWFERLGVPILTSTEPRAYYTPAKDQIHMPPVETFETTGRYIATLAHEEAHATMTPNRCNRRFGNRSELTCRAKEELVAELSSAMICARLGLVPEFDQHAAYLMVWIPPPKGITLCQIA